MTSGAEQRPTGLPCPGPHLRGLIDSQAAEAISVLFSLRCSAVRVLNLMLGLAKEQGNDQIMGDWFHHRIGPFHQLW